MDLRHALVKGRLGDLNPFPWVMMTGNCLGWLAYGYYLQPNDAFVVAASLPGLVLSLWLNSGAAKLQYQELRDLQRLQEERNQHEWDADDNPEQEDNDDGDDVALNPESQRRGPRRGGRRRRRQRQEERQQANLLHEYHPEYLVTTPQERALMQIVCLWILVLVWVGWIGQPRNAAPTVGIVMNLNLVFFYAAPLQTMKQIIFVDLHSNSIHRPTMYMNWINTSFWILYGLARRDYVIVTPNAIGLSLGVAQGVLCFCYPPSPTASSSNNPSTTAPHKNKNSTASHLPVQDHDGAEEDAIHHSNTQSLIQSRQSDGPPASTITTSRSTGHDHTG